MEDLFTGFYDRRIDGSRKWQYIPDTQECYKNKIVPMTVADLDLPTAPIIKQSLIDYIEGRVLGYSNPTQKYLKAVTNHMKEFYDYRVESDWIITTPGIVSALSTSVRAYTNPGDGVIMFPPVYYHFYEVVENQNREIISCPLVLENGEYFINFDLFEEVAAEEKNKLLMLCSPHNPGGRVWTKEELQKITEIAIKHNLIIVSDEIHADLTFNHKEHYILSSINEEIEDKSIICTSASKAFNISGLQCSNIIIPNEALRESFSKEKMKTGVQVANVLGMKATEIAYEKGIEWLSELMNILERNRQLTINYFKEADERFKIMEPDASFLVWVNIEDFNIPNEEFINILEKECQLYVTDGNVYGDKGDNWLRINFGMSTDLLEKNLKRLKNLPV